MNLTMGLGLLLTAGGLAEDQAKPPVAKKWSPEAFEKVDELDERATANLGDFKEIAVIDHARLAAKEGVSMPPAILTIFSDATGYVSLMKSNPRVGVDLPHKVLAFAEADGEFVSFAGSDFLATRHGIEEAGLLAPYQENLEKALKGVPAEQRSAVKSELLVKDYGLIELSSDYSFEDSVKRLKETVMAQGDTVWFGEVDFQKEAKKHQVDLLPATLLLFGGPKPGGVAMSRFPKLGLDAFCQKLLVYEAKDGGIKVLFNDIAALSKLHYGVSIPPHQMLNQRLKQTFEGAVKKAE